MTTGTPTMDHPAPERAHSHNTVPPPALCPECSTPTSLRRPAPPPHWTHWRTLIPRLTTAVALLAAALILAWPAEPEPPGRPVVAGVGSIDLAHPLRGPDLQSPPAGDDLVREITAALAPTAPFYGPGQLQAGIGSDDDANRFWVTRTRGWPIQTAQRSFSCDDHDTWTTFDFDAANPLAAEPWTPAPNRPPFERSWSRGGTVAPETLHISAAGIVLALLAADLLRRALRPLVHRSQLKVLRRLPPAAAAALLAAAAAALLLPAHTSRGRQTTSGPVPTWSPLALTDADLRPLLGRDDADAVLLSAVAAAIGNPGDTPIRLAIDRSVALTHSMRDYGRWEPRWYIARAHRASANGEPRTFPPTPLWFRPSINALFFELPAPEDARDLVGIGIHLGPTTALLLPVYLACILPPLAVHLAAHLIARRRHARGLCITCGYHINTPTNVPQRQSPHAPL